MNTADTSSSPQGVTSHISSLLPSGPFGRAFAEGLLAGLLVFVCLLGWMHWRADRTAERSQDLFPFKSVDIVRDSSPPAHVPASSPSTDQDNEKAAGAIPDKSAAALPPAPLPGLSEEYQGRKLPIVRVKDDMTPFDAYKKPFSAPPGKSLVSIVILDYGLSDTPSQKILKDLPAETTLVMTPYADRADEWSALARQSGHEFWLSLPMQTEDPARENTGPDTLMINASIESNRARLFDVLAATTGYAGLVSQRNHAFTGADLDVSPVMKQIFGRGLAFAESNPSVPAYGLSMAMQYGYPYVQNNIWLDADLRPESIDRALMALELQASRKGKAVAFSQPYPLVIDHIRAWLAKAGNRDIVLAPLSAMAQ